MALGENVGYKQIAKVNVLQTIPFLYENEKFVGELLFLTFETTQMINF